MSVLDVQAQRFEALALANDVRSRRSQLKRDIAAGRKSGAEAILNPPDWALGMPILELLRAVPKVGRVRAGKTLGRAGVSPTKRIGQLTERQRALLAEPLGPNGWRHA